MAKRKRRKSKLDPYVHKVGILPDRAVAELAGVTSENVRAFRNRRGIPARWRGEGEQLPNEAEVLAAAGLDAAPDQPRAQRRRARVGGAGGGAAQAQAAGLKVAQGFVVAVETGAGQQEFVVVGADIAQASSLAMQSLEARGVQGKVVGIRYLADALMA